MAIERRKRLPDGSFGPLEKVLGGETDAEKMARLESENALLAFSLVEKDVQFNDLVSQLKEKGVL